VCSCGAGVMRSTLRREAVPLRSPHTGAMAAEQQAIRVTTAGMSGTDDRHLRQRRYAQTQVIRVACFILAVVLPVPLWVQLLLIVGAFTLPWLGVVSANAGPTLEKKRSLEQVTPLEEPVRLALDPGRTIDQD
jgi:hypothetical protein